MNQQRQVIYSLRKEALAGDKRLDFVDDGIKALASTIVTEHSPQSTGGTSWNFESLEEALANQFHTPVKLDRSKIENATIGDLVEMVSTKLLNFYNSKIEKIGKDQVGRLERWIYLQIIDRAWKNHLQAMDALKDSVSLRGYGQRDPLQEYKKEGFKYFEELMGRIHDETVVALLTVEIPDQAAIPTQSEEAYDEEELEFKHPAAASLAESDHQDQNGDPSRNRDGNESAKNDLIYHGSRKSMEPEPRGPLAPLKRELDKIGRNDPCPCGSGKKYKKCHGTPATEQSGAKNP
jgi:preprotein translocase subunit SecA